MSSLNHAINLYKGEEKPKRKFIAVNVSGGYTELENKDGENQVVLNGQVLLHSTAENKQAFVKELKSMWEGFNIGEIVIIETSQQEDFITI